MSLFLRRSLSESSENLQRSPSLASIRENDSSDSWSTHENADDRNDRIQGKCESRKLDYVVCKLNLIKFVDDVSSENVATNRLVDTKSLLFLVSERNVFITKIICWLLSVLTAQVRFIGKSFPNPFPLVDEINFFV